MFFPEEAPPTLQALRVLWSDRTGVFIAALLTTLLLTPVLRHVAIRQRLYDMPDTRLKPHGHPIPYLGGLAIFLGVLLPLVVTAWCEWVEQSTTLWCVLAAMTLIVAAGLLDDLIDLKPVYRIGVEVVAALMLAAGGIIFRGIPAEFFGLSSLVGQPWLLVSLGIVIQVALVVGACNAMNLLDGLDGLCSGVTAIIAVGFVLLATSIVGWDMWGHAPHYEFAGLILVISFALCGAALGFLPYNFNPASIFMGDAGSMLLGFLSAVLVIMFAERPAILKWALGALFIFGLPLFDTTLAFMRRWLNGKPIFAGDRSHFYDQLVDRGLTVKQAVMVCYGLALFFAITGVAIIFMQLRYGILVYLAVGAGLTIFVIKAGMLRADTADQ